MKNFNPFFYLSFYIFCLFLFLYSCYTEEAKLQKQSHQLWFESFFSKQKDAQDWLLGDLKNVLWEDAIESKDFFGNKVWEIPVTNCVKFSYEGTFVKVNDVEVPKEERVHSDTTCSPHLYRLMIVEKSEKKYEAKVITYEKFHFTGTLDKTVSLNSFKTTPEVYLRVVGFNGRPELGVANQKGSGYGFWGTRKSLLDSLKLTYRPLENRGEYCEWRPYEVTTDWYQCSNPIGTLNCLNTWQDLDSTTEYGWEYACNPYPIISNR